MPLADESGQIPVCKFIYLQDEVKRGLFTNNSDTIFASCIMLHLSISITHTLTGLLLVQSFRVFQSQQKEQLVVLEKNQLTRDILSTKCIIRKSKSSSLSESLVSLVGKLWEDEGETTFF